MSKKHEWFDGRWDIKHIRNGKIIWEVKDKSNILVDQGEKAVVDTFFRNNSSIYFASDNFWAGLYKGTISESTTLVTIPNEPSGNGYIRLQIERSTVGFPIIDQYEGHWRVTSKEVSLTAVGGDIGPINGAFLCTSLDNSGILIGAVAIDPERTIIAGDTIYFQLKIRQK